MADQCWCAGLTSESNRQGVCSSIALPCVRGVRVFAPECRQTYHLRVRSDMPACRQHLGRQTTTLQYSHCTRKCPRLQAWTPAPWCPKPMHRRRQKGQQGVASKSPCGIAAPTARRPGVLPRRAAVPAWHARRRESMAQLEPGAAKQPRATATLARCAAGRCSTCRRSSLRRYAPRHRMTT